MRRVLLLLLSLCWPLAGLADEMLVIAHPGVAVSSLNMDELSAIYLLKMTSWRGGDNIVPVNREAASPMRTSFSDAVLHQPPNALAAYWNQMHFKGKMPPVVQESDQAVLAFVQKVPGAVGYVSASLPVKNVKVLARIP